MTTWLLVLIYTCGYQGGLTSIQLNTEQACISAGEDYVANLGGKGFTGRGRFTCIELKDSK